ncbi:MAG: peroxiredoxin [Marmoricola sp.]
MGLPIGAEAPDFSLVDQHGSPFRLSDLRGSKSILLAFYPFAFSGVCTGELTGFRDNLGEFETDTTTLAAISCDPIYSIRMLADRDALFFPLLSDFWPHGAVASAYGVFDTTRGSPTRSSYVVDRDGRISFALHNEPGEARELSVQAAALRQA